MSANEFYAPAFVGGTIRGVQISLENTTGSAITAAARNGVYYVYQGHKFQLLGCDSVIIPANGQKIVTVELRDYTVPSTDVKIMVDTAGLAGITATVEVLWSVE
jgi:hypothetical protein